MALSNRLNAACADPAYRTRLIAEVGDEELKRMLDYVYGKMSALRHGCKTREDYAIWSSFAADLEVEQAKRSQRVVPQRP